MRLALVKKAGEPAALSLYLPHSESRNNTMNEFPITVTLHKVVPCHSVTLIVLLNCFCRVSSDAVRPGACNRLLHGKHVILRF